MNLYQKSERFNLARLGMFFALLLVMTSTGYARRQFLSVGIGPQEPHQNVKSVAPSTADQH